MTLQQQLTASVEQALEGGLEDSVDPAPGLSSIASIIDEARAGRMFILIDDDRKNEGDLVIPAQAASAVHINFMARHGRGLICLALSSERARALGLPMMKQSNYRQDQTAFTVSIEAKEGVTTGISAADRAQTIKVAVDPQSTQGELVSPGHVFPIVARDGGVLVRPGHTEAAIDIAELAGLNLSAVLCPILNAEGGMARMDQLYSFARQHSLKVGSIRDLVAFRREVAQKN